MKIIHTNGISFLEILGEGSSWYCGTDYASGDLYEAEEIHRAGKKFRPNRLIFVHHPNGEVYEPIPAREGQYFGRPAQIDGRIYVLLVDFYGEMIRILDGGENLANMKTLVEIPLGEVEDCYNLLLRGNPLMLTRQGGEGTFQILWPEKAEFAMGPNEAFIRREGDNLYFSAWFEDPDYREEVIIRKCSDGEIVDRVGGSVFIPPCKEMWVLK